MPHQSRTARRIPPWIVTAPHRIPHSLAGLQPWGVRHARQGDTQFTACGKSILTWRVFWHLGFETTHPQVCADCVRAVAHSSATASSDRSAAAS